MKMSRKAFLGISVGLFLGIVSTFVSSQSNLQDTTKIKTFQVEDISMSKRKVAYYDPLIIAPYKTLEIFISDEIKSDFNFTSVGGYWTEVSPQGTNVEIQLRFMVDGNWSEWLDLEEEVESSFENTTKKYTIASSNPATAMQYKVFMYGDGTSTPYVKDMEWSFIKAADVISRESIPAPEIVASNYSSSVDSLNLSSSSVDVISRTKWGANEEYRYLENNDEEAELIPIDEDWYEKYADELQYSKVIEADSDGRKYKWPLQYPEKVKKFIIHHTATTSNLDDPKQAIRDIYYYHSMTRGWGDIGYNYIVDKNGKIYEGRYGGEGVIGAHAGPGNNGSIGIAVLGNYEESSVPKKVTNSLTDFIAEKAKLHDIDPDGSSKFRGETMDNIFGHRDIMATTCPGQNLYAKIPTLQKMAAKALKNKKDKYVNDYEYEDVSNLSEVEIKAGETKKIKIKFENIGKKTWDKNTYLTAKTDSSLEGVISFTSGNMENLAKMKETKVSSGKKATFEFEITAGTKGETVYLNLAPVVNGTTKIESYKLLPITVVQSDYKYQLVDSSFPSGLEPGQTFDAWVKLKNKGNITWKNSGDEAMVLRTDHVRDRISKFNNSNILATLKEKEVKPGKTGTFNFKLTAPMETGLYKEYFTPYIGNYGWMNDAGMYFETSVYGSGYSAEVSSMSSLTDLKKGKSYTLWIKLRNLGSEPWTKDNIKMVFVKEEDLIVKDAYMENEEVKSGEIATIYFTVVVDKNEELGQKNLMLRPTVNDNQLFNRSVYFYYTVSENTPVQTEFRFKNTDAPNPDVQQGTLNYSEGKIRIKLSFSGNPQITGSSNYSIWAGDKNLSNPKADQITEVKYEDGSYKITVNGNSYTSTYPVRFGVGSGILRIDNLSKSPGFNASLNDNQYRGVLEVREDNGQLIVINDLPLEDYMKGLAEVPNDELTEKMKAIIVAARSYAKYYVEIDDKFPGKPYDLEDDPNTSQKYLGYGFEKRAPNVAAAVEATRGEVVSYNGSLVKTPYFSQSDGVATKSAKDVWNWDAPYLVSVSDTYCTTGKEFKGHGVGMSGCGARGMAENGYTYTDILKHYYTGIEIADLY